MRRLTISAVCFAAALAALPASGAARGGRVQARAAGTCGVGAGRGYGYSYLTWLWVYRTSCSTGRSLAKHHGHVSGWRCSRRILDSSPVQYDAKVTCSSGHRKVQWTFTENK